MSRDFADLHVHLAAHVATVEIDRPPHNFFDHALVAQIADAYEALDDNPDCRAIVLASNGKSFCAGADFGSRRAERKRPAQDGAQRGSAAEGFRSATAALYRACVRIFRAGKPVVAAIQGAAIGGGLGLALTADFRIAAREARFAANFAKLGTHPGFGLTATLPRLVGRQTASRMFLTGCRIPGADAVRLGLADRLADAAELRATAAELAAEIAANAPLAVYSARAALRRGLADAVADATERELEAQQRLRGTADFAEGIRAVAERRPGNFRSC